MSWLEKGEAPFIFLGGAQSCEGTCWRGRVVVEEEEAESIQIPPEPPPQPEIACHSPAEEWASDGNGTRTDFVQRPAADKT